MGPDFDYKSEVQSLDFAAVKADIVEVLRASRTGGPRTSATTAA